MYLPFTFRICRYCTYRILFANQMDNNVADPQKVNNVVCYKDGTIRNPLAYIDLYVLSIDFCFAFCSDFHSTHVCSHLGNCEFNFKIFLLST